MQKEETGAAQNNEEYLKHFGFTVDDLSFLISPQSSLSPIKKKQRNVFNFENVGDELDASAPAPAVPGPYPANYPTVYQDTYDQSAPYIKEEVHENEHEHDHGPIPSFEGLDLTSFENENSDEYVKAPPSYGSNNAQCGSEASSIATEPIDIGFSRMGSSMGMGSLNFSTMSSFNFDEADADAMLAQDALNALSSMSAQNGHGRVPEGVADMAGLWPAGSVGSMLSMSLNPSHNSRVNNTMMSLPPLPQMPASHMHVEDASYILNGQGHPHNNTSGNNSNRASWNHQEFQQRSSRANPDGSTATPPLSRISSFKSTLSPLSVDMNALNAAHQAHQEARLYQQSFGGNSANHSRNSSFYSTQQSMNHGGNVSSSDRSSGASSPERNSFGSGQAVGKRAKRATEKERERRGSRSSRDDPAGAAAMLLSLSSGFNKETKSNADKKAEKAAERAAEKAAEKEREKQKEKEQKEKEDTRASKSLATISRRFVEHFGDTNTFEYISGMLHVDDVHDGPPVTNRVDGAAEVLGVHVRRIYELIKILEILSLVTFTGDKRGKFGWRGTKDFLITLGTIQAEGITKYPEIAYSHGIRLPEQPLQSPSAACGSPLTMSLPSTPVYMEGQTSPFFGASGSSSKARGRHPGFESAVQDSERDRSAALALGPGSSSGIGYENDSVNPYDKHLTASVGTASEPSAGYASHLATSLDIDLSSTLMDPDPQSSSSPIAQLESTELTDLDAFAAHMLSTDVPMELSQPEMMPKYSKKRAAVKKSSKSATPAGDKAAGDSHEEFMVEGICKSFLQLFLVGMDGLSMNFAIQKLVPMEPNQTLHEYNKLNATKIRRVYDVANVLCSLNLINKNTITAAKKGAKSEMNTPDSHSHSHASYQSRESPHKEAMNSHNNSWTANTNTNNMNNMSSMNNMNSMNMYGNNGHPANGTPMIHTLVGHNNNNESSNSFQDASSTTGKARGEGGKGDKLLEWGSFPPTVIRDYYLNKMCI